ncbi:ABC transporter substrate-binding protein [Propylenella binzhouense]|uniref:ABC transporter substrate-binding protein n=1 Tax=Propylenella binzhouense TaxID=2555902 RepID=A0A964T1M8_9HYPH|nr:ABC transporter substrate-binding protein [Propylenella binzhouense]MYZ46334.1 ABC transporter substrate-binding protein [Propylenella binzhouense]
MLLEDVLRPALSVIRNIAIPIYSLALAGVLAATVPAAAEDAATPLYGGTMVVGLATEPSTLNIALTTNLPESLVAGNLYNKLLRLGIKEEFLPELATSWEVSPDALAYTFRLTEGAKWHDGVPFTSADVKYSLEELTKRYHPNASMMAPVKSIETPDANTVVITLTQPSEPFLVFLALRAYILPKHIYENTDIRQNPANMKPVGTGPYKFVSWDRGSQITLERNPDYFEKGLPYIDRFVYRVMPDASSRILALENGEVDYLTHDIPSTSLAALRKNPDLTVTTDGVSSIVAISQLMFNLDREPYDDVRVRRALTMALDKTFIAERSTLGAYTRSDGPIHSLSAWAYDKNALTIYPYDVKGAEALLDEAGLKKDANGVRFSMEIIAPRGRDDQVRAAQIISEMYGKVGVKATVKILDNSAVGQVVYVDRNFDALVNLLTTGPDPAVGVERQYVSSNIRPVPFTNASAYRNPEVDALFADAAKATSRETRAAHYSKIQAILSKDAAETWLWEVTPYSISRNEFKNLHKDSAAAVYHLFTGWWTGGKPKQ